MKCKNVISGCLSKYDISEITIIDGYRVLYSGDIESFFQKCDLLMIDFRNEILKRNVIEKTILGNKKLFLFLKQEAV